MNEKLISFQDVFAYIPNVARNIDPANFEPAILEAQRFKIAPIIGNALYADLIANQTSPAYVTLMSGGTYLDCEGDTVLFFGMKPAIVHYAFAIFADQNQYKMTDSGVMIKSNEWSDNAKKAERNQLAVANEQRAVNYMHEVVKFLRSEKSTYQLFKCGKLPENIYTTYFIAQKYKYPPL